MWQIIVTCVMYSPFIFFAIYQMFGIHSCLKRVEQETRSPILKQYDADEAVIRGYIGMTLPLFMAGIGVLTIKLTGNGYIFACIGAALLLIAPLLNAIDARERVQ